MASSRPSDDEKFAVIRKRLVALGTERTELEVRLVCIVAGKGDSPLTTNLRALVDYV